MREKILFDKGWKFHRGDLCMRNTVMKGPDYMGAKTERMLIGAAAYDYKDESDSYDPSKMSGDLWENVRLPHDYVIEQTPSPEYPQALGYLKYENAWYRKHFTLDKEDADKRITLYFEGVATNATVYLNGCLMKHNFCGYTPFEVDITDIAYFDKENVLAVYTDSSTHEGWWYQGGGIYRHVWLIKTNPVAVDLWGVYINPVKTEDKWNVNVETTIINSSMKDEDICIRSMILDSDQCVIAQTSTDMTAAFKDKTVITQCIDVKEPKLWDTDAPNLYTLVTRIYKTDTGELIDETEDTFGFRTFRFDSQRGFILNDRQIKLKGVCSHQDFGITGKAVPDNIYEYRIDMIKEMGANAYRTSHYPHAEATMDALDKNGILVMDETRWYESTDEGISQLETLIKRDRNHPSVILWSIGNEEPKHVTEQGRRIAENMITAARRLDSSRPITTAVSNDPINSTVLDLVDVIGVNYNLNQYDDIHRLYPDKPFVSTECCATATTRGSYLDPSAFTSSYDIDVNEWFLGREKTWKFMCDREWVSGSFQWIAFEHRGECVWPRLCSVSGAIDLYLQKKDAFYQNKSHWSDTPMVHILPHWNHKGLEGEPIKVWVYTNCDEVELFLNEKSLGAQKIERFGHGEWIVNYESGGIRAIGRNGGKKCAEEFIETTGEPEALGLVCENKVEYANGRDILLFSCVCVDSCGREVPDAEPTVRFETNSFGRVIGTGANICDHIPPQCTERRMKSGRCTIAVQVGETSETLKVYAISDGLKTAIVTIELK